MMQKLKKIRVDRKTGLIRYSMNCYDSSNCSICEKGDTLHALREWDDALIVDYYEDEPRYGAPLLMGFVFGFLLAASLVSA